MASAVIFVVVTLVILPAVIAALSEILSVEYKAQDVHACHLGGRQCVPDLPVI